MGDGPTNFTENATAWTRLVPAQVAARLRHLPGLVFFDTAGNVPSDCRAPVSILAARPTRVLTGNIHHQDDRRALREELACGARECPDGGGLCGWVEYDGNYVFGVYPEMLVYHHADGTWHEAGGLSSALAETPPDEGAAQVGPFSGSMTRAEYLSAVRRAREWIAAGDIYQVNLSHRMRAGVSGGSLFPLYGELRDCSPSPMGAWLSLAGREVLCSSPELFLRVTGDRVETRPIKGTRPRFADPVADARSAAELKNSAKETAELVMITDLLRNDLGRVCGYGSVRVDDLLSLETLGQVHHLVSTVSGRLREDMDAVEALAACFPGGSITGAPKIRAMQIIGELESVPRGLYCGAIGWFGFGGGSCFNIAIRTLVREGGELSYHVGAGIVADSDPDMEYEETLHKAEGIRQAVENWQKRAVFTTDNLPLS
jgi:aminodeoxychorismate synthase component I